MSKSQFPKKRKLGCRTQLRAAVAGRGGGGWRGVGGGRAGACKGRVEQVVVSHLLHTNSPDRNCGQI